MIAPGAASPPPGRTDTMIGKTISRYRIEEKLGSSGMGEVYRRHDKKLDPDVAPKVLLHPFANDDQRVGAFTPPHPHLKITKLITRMFST